MVGSNAGLEIIASVCASVVCRQVVWGYRFGLGPRRDSGIGSLSTKHMLKAIH